MRLIFRSPNIPPALNGKDGLLRIHWSKRKALKQSFQWLIKEQSRLKYTGTMKCTIVNYYARLPMDWDNLASRFKIVGDALVANKQIPDDSPKYIVDFQMVQEKVKTVKENRLEVIIEPI